METDFRKIRQDFPILDQTVYKRPLVYLDNAATTQKPAVVTGRVSDYYNTINSNIHRGVHYLSQQATTAYEEARNTVRDFIHAGHSRQIIFTRGTTEAINLVAYSFGKKFVGKGDEILLTVMEHHSNLVPWQLMAEDREARVVMAPVTPEGVLDLEAFERLINPRTRIIALAHVSNVLGTVNPVEEIIRTAHAKGIPVLVDGAQAVPHMAVDMTAMDCDFYCFSGHKMYGPMGIGVLYGRESLLESMPPYQGGGEMIREVTLEKTTFSEIPFRFEAGTPNVGDALGLETAVKYMNGIGMDRIRTHEADLLKYATSRLTTVEGLKIIGTAQNKASVISFVLEGIHHYDAGTILDKLGIALRTGHHCAQPVMEWLGITGTLRASFALYNTREEVDILVEGLLKVKQMFG